MALTIEALVNSEGPDPKYLYGIDISSYQGKADKLPWDKVAASGVSFVYCKATEGVTIQDSQFRDNYKNLEPVLPRGAYHFFRGGNSGAKQAENFLKQIEDIWGFGADLPPVIDVEALNGSIPMKDQIKYILEWVDIVTARLSTTPMIYTSLRVVRDLFGNTDAFKDIPLWTVDYRMSPTIPKMPNGFTDWVLWQFSDKCVVPGLPSSGVDVDRFNGNSDAFTEWLSGTHL